MKKSVREVVRATIESYLLNIDIEEIIEEKVVDMLDEDAVNEMIEQVFDIEAIIGEELSDVLEELLG